MVRVAQTDLMPDFTGRKLNGVQLMEYLGSGAYGKVYRACDSPVTPQSKIYAVKCLNRPEPGSKTELLQQREFSLHKRVSAHPNIVTFHRHFRDERYVYVVLDLCTGGDLFGAITEKRLFQNNDRRVKIAFLQLIDAVQYCHDLGVFHRDIKPENVLCSNDGADIRLADFGLSIQSPVCQDLGCGSSYYMSPGMSLFFDKHYHQSHTSSCRMYWERPYFREIFNSSQRRLGPRRNPHQHDYRPQSMEIRNVGRRLLRSLSSGQRLPPSRLTYL